MLMLFIWFMFGAITAVAATNKGRSGCGWFMLGMLLGPFGFILSLLASDKRTEANAESEEDEEEDLKKCPYCAELIKTEAIKCRYCGSELPKDVNSCPMCDGIVKNNDAGEAVCADCGSKFFEESKAKPGDRICPKCKRTIPEGKDLHPRCFGATGV